MRKIGLYEISVIFFFVIVPVIGTVVEMMYFNPSENVFILLLKWFAFSGVGLRLFSAGLKQAINPSFTATEIFKADEKSYLIVRELGFANICIGIIGIISFFFSDFMLAAAVAGSLYFGLAGCLHLFHKRDKDEIFAMISDFFIFFVLATLIVVKLIQSI